MTWRKLWFATEFVNNDAFSRKKFFIIDSKWGIYLTWYRYSVHSCWVKSHSYFFKNRYKLNPTTFTVIAIKNHSWPELTADLRVLPLKGVKIRTRAWEMMNLDLGHLTRPFTALVEVASVPYLSLHLPGHQPNKNPLQKIMKVSALMHQIMISMGTVKKCECKKITFQGLSR